MKFLSGNLHIVIIGEKRRKQWKIGRVWPLTAKKITPFINIFLAIFSPADQVARSNTECNAFCVKICEWNKVLPSRA